MKKILFVFILLGIFSCKKKEDPIEQPVVVPPPLKTSTMTASVNGTVWVVQGNQTSTANIAQTVYAGTPKQYIIGGRTAGNMNKNSIHIGFAAATGTANLASFTNYYALYYDSTGTSYPVQTGTIHISAIDTSRVKTSACDKFKATFSFVTSSVAGVSYTVDQGSIDFEAN